MNERNPNGWPEYQRLVLARLDEIPELRKEVGRLYGLVSCLDKKVATLKTELSLKSGVWGAVAGLIPAVGILLYLALR